MQFSEPINLQQLAYQAFEVTAQATLPQVFVEGADGTKYYPRFLSYDRATNQATFQMLDGLPNGSYALHLSGPGGLTDLGGNPIAGNDPSGDYVIPFTVQGPAADLRVTCPPASGSSRRPARDGLPGHRAAVPRRAPGRRDILRYPESPAAPGAAATQDSYMFQVMESRP